MQKSRCNTVSEGFSPKRSAEFQDDGKDLHEDNVSIPCAVVMLLMR